MDTLNRKYLMQAIDGSLERIGLDFIDLVYCHRADPNTPIEETVWAMSDMITRGKALYWGTSEWTAADIRAAWEIAEQAPPAQAGDGAAAVQPVPPQAASSRSTRASTTTSASASRPGARSRSGLLTGKYRERHPGRQPRRAREHVLASPRA